MEPPVKLNIGCGKTIADGWINIDKSPSVLLSSFPRLRKALLATRVLEPQQADGFPPGAIHANVVNRIPIADNSADFVYSAHMIEHLSRWEGLRFVRECRRVLRDGAVIRLATPDLEMMARDYLNGRSPFMESAKTPADAFCAEYGAFANSQGNLVKAAIRKLVSGNSHQWLYDQTSMAELLREGGFTEITPRTYRQGLTPDLVSVEHRERGLFVEARVG
jgi:predicted SAM-dependent methyltransferase